MVVPVASGGEESGAVPGIRRTRLPNGIRVVTEHMPGVRSVAIGFWIGAGARDEPPDLAGASHFLEHLLFKGTPNRTAREIAEAIDAVGGEMNAFTAKEYTAFYTRLPDHEVERGLEILTDVLSAPAFRPHEIEAERQVILEEILMDEDSPEDRVHTLLFSALFPDHPLGREVAGRRETISAIQRDDIVDFFSTWYRPRNLVVAAAGNVEHEQLTDAICRRLGDAEGGTTPDRSPPDEQARRVEVLRRPTEQAHLAIGFRSLARRDPDRYALAVCNQVLGGGMSSRLFQEIREERGLAYSVYSAVSPYSDAGALAVYAGTAPGRAHEVLDLLHAELDGLVENGVTEQELAVAKGFLEGSLILGLEDTTARMSRLGSAEQAVGEVVHVDEHVARFRAVTRDDVARVIDRVLARERTLAVVGPFEPTAFQPADTP